MKRLNRRGDTIVEVLISIAVAGSTLVIAYSIMNRSMFVVRSNQERSEATRIAQEQIEAINRLVGERNAAIADIDLNTEGFCVTSDGVQPMVNPPAADAADDDFTEDGPYAAHCNQNGLYNFAAVKIADDTYRVRVRWERIGGGERNEVVMSYRAAP